MMHIMLYEKFNSGEPKVGDYVICEEQQDIPTLYDFLHFNVGVICEVINDKIHKYKVRYSNIPDNVDRYFHDDKGIFYKGVNKSNMYMYRNFSTEEIKYWSEDINDMNMIINSRIYNI